MQKLASALILSVLALGCGGKKPAASGPTPTTAAVNGCSDYKDMIDAGANSIPWDASIAGSPMRCIKIKVGATVGYTGNFTANPMKASGGATPNPFDQALANVSNPGDADEQTNVAFTAPGTFGFVSSAHAEMTGAVLVIP